MTRSRTKQMKTSLLGAVVIAAATMAASPSVFSQQVWSANTAKQNILSGAPIVAKRIASSDIATYCNVASTPGTHFTWTDMAGSGLDYSYAWAMWAASCPTAVATMRGAEIIYAERVDYKSGALPVAPAPRQVTEKEIEHATAGGAMVLISAVDSATQASQAVSRAYYPPLGARSVGPGQFDTVYPASVTGGDYRNTYNDNLVVITQIGTVAGAMNANAIAAVPGTHAIFLDAQNLASSAGYAEGSADYNKLADAIKTAAKAKNKHLCTADLLLTPYTLTCVKQP